jgi:chromate transporter
MSTDSAPAAPRDQEPDLTAARGLPPSLLALCMAFGRMSLAGFGGVLVFARGPSSSSTCGAGVV